MDLQRQEQRRLGLHAGSLPGIDGFDVVAEQEEAAPVGRSRRRRRLARPYQRLTMADGGGGSATAAGAGPVSARVSGGELSSKAIGAVNAKATW